MPGPAAQPVAQAWPQAPTTTMLPAAPPQPQPYNGPNSQSLTGQWQQMQNSAANQWQQMNTQAQQQAQQAYANAQQQLNQVPAQFNQQANQAMNQANQQMNQAFQAGQQQAQQGLNQANQQFNQALQAGQQQVAQYPPQQPTNPTWNPFATPAASQPPARATPVAVPRY
jgi:cell division protein FtsN